MPGPSPGTDVIEQHQPKIRRQPLDDQPPQVLITPETVSQHDGWSVLGPDNSHVVPGGDVHLAIFHQLFFLVGVVAGRH